MLRTIGAVAAGYMLFAVLVFLIFKVTQIVYPSAYPTPNSYPPLGIALSVQGLGFLAAMAGGYLTARIAIKDHFKHTVILAILGLILGLVNLFTSLDVQPLWYLMLQIVVTVAGVLIGGKLVRATMAPRDGVFADRDENE